MSQIIHMDTEQVQNTAKQLSQTSQQILQLVQEMLRQAHNIPWEGQSRDEFIFQFEDMSRGFSNVAEQGHVLASRVEREVAKWQSCDATLGGAPGQAGGPSFPFPSTGQKLPDGKLPRTLELGEQPEAPGETSYTTLAIGEEGQNPFTQLSGEQPESTRPITMAVMPGETPEHRPPIDLTALGGREDGQNPFDRTEFRAGEGSEGHSITSPTSDRPEALPPFDIDRTEFRLGESAEGGPLTSPFSDKAEAQPPFDFDRTEFRVGERAEGGPLTSPTSDRTEAPFPFDIDRTEFRAGENAEGGGLTSPSSDSPEARPFPSPGEIASILEDQPDVPSPKIPASDLDNYLQSVLSEDNQQNLPGINITPDVTP